MSSDRDTIFALSSGRPPAAVAVVRISGPRAGVALETLIGRVPVARRASLARVRDPASGDLIDEGLALWFPGPNSETGEDIVELQVHGGRAVIAALLAALGRFDGLRHAEAGEFTRRAFENGRMDLTAVELAIGDGVVGARLEWNGVATTGAVTHHVPCPGQTGWLAYAGGFYVATPTCLPIVVRAASREQTVRIAVGVAC